MGHLYEQGTNILKDPFAGDAHFSPLTKKFPFSKASYRSQFICVRYENKLAEKNWNQCL